MTDASKMLRLLTKNEQIAHSLTFLIKEKSDLLRKLMSEFPTLYSRPREIDLPATAIPSSYYGYTKSAAAIPSSYGYTK